MHQRLAFLAAFAIAATLAACDRRDDSPVVIRAQTDSASGEVAQYSLMKNTIGWLTDSNIVALASQVNADAKGVAELEAQVWSKEMLRAVATEIVREHARFQYSIDSVASLRRIPSQAPAIAPEIRVFYDSTRAAQAALSLPEREGQFFVAVAAAHSRSVTDLGALAANATDPDLRALLINRGVMMEQAHLSKLKLLGGAVSRADSAREDSLKARRGR
jgi:hypothetical protein